MRLVIWNSGGCKSTHWLIEHLINDLLSGGFSFAVIFAFY